MSLARDRGLALVGSDGRLAGVLTTGDLTRLAERDPDFLGRPVSQVMTAHAARPPRPDDLAAAAVGTMERNGVIVLPVVLRRRHGSKAWCTSTT